MPVTKRKKQKGGEHENVTAAGFAAPVAGDSDTDTVTNCASRKTKRRGDDNDATDCENAPASSNGHANERTPTSYELRDLAGGEGPNEPDDEIAARKTKRRSIVIAKPNGGANGTAAGGEGRVDDDTTSAACRALQELERRRACIIKSRVRIGNEVTANVAIVLGYHAGLDEAERKNLWNTAAKIVASIQKETELPPDLVEISNKVFGLVAGVTDALDHFDRYQSGIDKEMVRLAASLPVAKWAEGVRGFGLLRLAVIIGETGDLSTYGNPGKVWKRLGLAPISKGGATKMPSTWRSKGGLSSEEWTTAGYSPRRRSIAFVVSELLVKLNDGVYRARYDEAKATFAAADPERSKGHCHNHAMLCCVKRLVRDLWIEWRKAVSA